MLLKNDWIKKEIKRKIKRHIEMKKLRIDTLFSHRASS